MFLSLCINYLLFSDKLLVIDGTDNFETRFLINEFCVKDNISRIYGSILAKEIVKSGSWVVMGYN